MIALACDFRVAVETAKAGLLFVRVGLAGADMGPRGCCLGGGTARATEMLMLGEPVTAPAAKEMGLVSYVTSDVASCLGKAQELAQKLAQGPLCAQG